MDDNLLDNNSMANDSMDNSSMANNSMDLRIRATRSGRQYTQENHTSRSRSRSPVVLEQNVPSTSGDQMMPLMVDFKKRAEEYKTDQKKETDSVLAIFQMCETLKEMVEEQQKNITTLGKKVKILENDVEKLKENRTCSQCNTSLENKKS